MCVGVPSSYVLYYPGFVAKLCFGFKILNLTVEEPALCLMMIMLWTQGLTQRRGEKMVNCSGWYLQGLEWHVYSDRETALRFPVVVSAGRQLLVVRHQELTLQRMAGLCIVGYKRPSSLLLPTQLHESIN